MSAEGTITRFLEEHLYRIPGEYVEMDRVWDLWRKWPDRVKMPERKLRLHLELLGCRVEADALLGYSGHMPTPPKPPTPPNRRKVVKPRKNAKQTNPQKLRIMAEMEIMGIPADMTWNARYKEYADRKRATRKLSDRTDASGWRQAAYRRKVRAANSPTKCCNGAST